MADDILVGLAGTGFIGPAHLEALRRNNVRVTGWRRRPLAGKAKAAELGVERAYPSFEAIIADPQIR